MGIEAIVLALVGAFGTLGVGALIPKYGGRLFGFFVKQVASQPQIEQEVRTATWKQAMDLMADMREEINRLGGKLDALRRDVDDRDKEVEAQRKEIRALRAKLAERDEQVMVLQVKVGTLEDKVRSLGGVP